MNSVYDDLKLLQRVGDPDSPDNLEIRWAARNMACLICQTFRQFGSPKSNGSGRLYLRLPRDYKIYYLYDISLRYMKNVTDFSNAPVLYSSDWDNEKLIKRGAPVISLESAITFAEDMAQGFFGELTSLIKGMSGQKALDSFQKGLKAIRH